MIKLKYSISLLTLLVILIAGCGKSDKKADVTDAQKMQSSKIGKLFKIDATSSSLEWTGKKVTGQHSGKINISGGELYLDKDIISGGGIDVDMKSLTDADLTDTANNAKLIKHLKSDDFFGTDKFPFSKFEITTSTPFKNANKPQYNYLINGNLTIKGVTKGISFPANVNITDGKVTAYADFDIDRTDFGLKYGSGKFMENLGDKMIYDNFNIKFNITAN